MMKNKVIYLEPDCFKKTNPVTSKQVMTDTRAIMVNSKNIETVAQNILDKYSEAESDETIEWEDFEYLESNELQLEKKQLNMTNSDSALITTLERVYDYFDLVNTKLVGIFDTCIATKQDIVELKLVTDLTLGNLASFYMELLAPAIRFCLFRAGLAVNPEEAMETYPDIDRDAILSISPIISQWLTESNKTIEELARDAVDLGNEFTVTTQLYLKYSGELGELQNEAKATGLWDAYSQYENYVLPQDFTCIKSKNVIFDEEYVFRLQKRSENYSLTELDILLKVAEVVPEEHQFLYDNEEYIDYEWCTGVLSAGKITSILRNKVKALKAAAAFSVIGETTGTKLF